jgi:hypothetical protein
MLHVSSSCLKNPSLFSTTSTLKRSSKKRVRLRERPCLLKVMYAFKESLLWCRSFTDECLFLGSFCWMQWPKSDTFESGTKAPNNCLSSTFSQVTVLQVPNKDKVLSVLFNLLPPLDFFDL